MHSSTGPTSALTAVRGTIQRTPLIILVWVAVVPAAKEHVPTKMKVVAQILNLVKYAPFTVKTAKEISTVLTALKLIKKLKARKK